MILNFKATYIVACAAILAVGIALADTPPAVISATSTGNTGAGLNGIAATTTELLITQPYCAGNQARGIYLENLGAGTSTLTTPLPERGVCSENYLAISPGLGGFTAGDTYATGASTNTNNEAVYKNGALFIDNIPASFHHAGITFDSSGTFGFDLIVTPLAALLAAARAVRDVYTELRRSGTMRQRLDQLLSFDDFNTLIDLARHYALEQRFRTQPE